MSAGIKTSSIACGGIMHRRLTVMAVIAALGISVATFSAAEAHADTCTGSYSIGVGGAKISFAEGTWEDSSYIYADNRIQYDTLNPRQGYSELDRAFWRHRALCPSGHIELVGHSEGAAIIHAWVTDNPVPDTSAVLLADPKRATGPAGAGLASIPGNWLIGWPLAGVDANFGPVPVLQVCNHDDVVCNVPAGWYGYVAKGTHLNYDFDSSDYPVNTAGVWFR
jgi:cutinase